MRKVLSVVALATLLTACEEKGYEINGQVSDIENGTTVYLEKLNIDNNQFIAIDSTTIKDNTFKFKGQPTNRTEQSFIHFKGETGRVPFILEDSKITVEYTKDKSLVSGGKYNKQYYSFIAKKEELTKPIVDFRTQNQEKYKEAQEKKDTATMESIKAEDKKLSEAYGEWMDNYLDTELSSIATLITYNEYARAGYLGKDELQPIFDSFSDDIKKTTIGQSLQEFISKMPEPAVKIGQKAPNFKALTPEGKELSLEEVLGKVTLIDFWASWCRPCRIENPNVVKLYNEYHDKGLNIIGVSLDSERENWLEAIEKDELTWNHISNLESWKDPIAKEYEVRGIPATFLLDENGVVIAKNLRGKKLRAKVAEILK
ncbi:TlpA disulfide reductase family protein [Myroides pelagicus]|uniref:Redoxin domain-containing protein n=1 Tax=Myroides pelagicus TaxID=270914 RepID=A0A7K1GJR3_9FLAO|nr:TlpA disulfide reductase family protein [Myroides pelagicus]MEC4113890.1 TlpA disulfide reductase family protein [Myroides pelagicus]MTH29125.1 redoxin domain-containing protein [Myroides pelagicus]